MNTIPIRLCTFIVIFLFAIIAKAAAQAWQIIPGESSITFTATQNNAPVTGQFKNFNGEINFDPAQLDSSQVKITVDMSSVNTSYQQISDTLKMSSWFDVKNFPQAVYTANHFVKTGNNSFQADGMLTIRDKTIPTTLVFTLEKYTSNEALAKGVVTLKRTRFAVGNGEWASTNSVKDDVMVNFVLSAKLSK